MTGVIEAASRALGETLTGDAPLAGGSIGRVVRAVTQSGESVVVKTQDAPVPDQFASEAHGLEWLRVPGGPYVPRVLAWSDQSPAFIVLEHIPAAPRQMDGIGARIAALHRAGAPEFGLDRPNVLATIPLDNTPLSDWPTFLAERRIRPLTRRAQDSGSLSETAARRLDRLCDRLDQFVGPAEPPSRLHGDLWSGNVLSRPDGTPVLIDPAVYGGHREIDLAMMRLFGGFDQRVFDEYDEAFPCAAGHEQRVALNQILPLLVHVILFGAGYVRQLERAVGQYVDSA